MRGDMLSQNKYFFYYKIINLQNKYIYIYFFNFTLSKVGIRKYFFFPHLKRSLYNLQVEGIRLFLCKLH